MCEKRIIWQGEPRRRGLAGDPWRRGKGGGEERGEANRRPGERDRRQSGCPGTGGEVPRRVSSQMKSSRWVYCLGEGEAAAELFAGGGRGGCVCAPGEVPGEPGRAGTAGSPR